MEKMDFWLWVGIILGALTAIFGLFFYGFLAVTAVKWLLKVVWG